METTTTTTRGLLLLRLPRTNSPSDGLEAPPSYSWGAAWERRLTLTWWLWARCNLHTTHAHSSYDMILTFVYWSWGCALAPRISTAVTSFSHGRTILARYWNHSDRALVLLTVNRTNQEWRPLLRCDVKSGNHAKTHNNILTESY